MDCSFTAISHGSSKFELLPYSTRAFETMITRSKNARKLDYLSLLLLDREDVKELRLFNMFPAVIKKYVTLFQDTRKDVDQVRKKQMGISTFFLTLVCREICG